MADLLPQRVNQFRGHVRLRMAVPFRLIQEDSPGTISACPFAMCWSQSASHVTHCMTGSEAL